MKHEQIPYARELNAHENEEIQVLELASNIKKYSVREIESVKSSPSQEHISEKVPNIYQNQVNFHQEGESREREVQPRVVRAVNLNQRQSISSQN